MSVQLATHKPGHLRTSRVHPLKVKSLKRKKGQPTARNTRAETNTRILSLLKVN